jgi:ferredoxin
MKVQVDQDVCIGTGNCVANSDTVFEIEGGVSHVKTDPVPAGEEDAARQAVEDCPVSAISIVED